jgi:hypothetical protein
VIFYGNQCKNKEEIKVEIKPCIKCGGEGELITTYDTEQIVCKNCGAETEKEVGDYYDEGFMRGDYVIPRWNRGEVTGSEIINKIIIDAIENKRQNKVKEYDIIIESVKKERNIATLYFALTKAFQNSMEQGEIGIKFLKDNLTNKFFKTAEIKNGVNNIVFSNDKYSVMFSKSFDKTITIDCKEEIKKPYYSNNFSSKQEELLNMLSEYIENKSLKNLKKLMYFRREEKKRNILEIFKLYMYARRKYTKELYAELKARKVTEEKFKQKYDKEMEVYNNKKQVIDNFIDGLTDLKMFEKEGFRIKKPKCFDEHLWY